MAETQSKGAARLNGLIGLLVGIFGALAILGVTAKILKWDSLLGFDYNTVIMVGFMGEAAAFVAMGLLAFFQGVTAKGSSTKALSAAGQPVLLDSPEKAALFHDQVREIATAEVKRIFGTMGDDYKRIFSDMGTDYKRMNAEMHQALVGAVQSGISSELSQLTAGLGQVMGELQGDVQRFGSEMRGMSQEMQQARTSVAQMRQTLTQTATGSLPQDAQRLGQGMSALSQEMGAAGTQAEAIRSELEQVARRFRMFNNPGVSSNGKDGASAETYVSRA
ncbi:MAG: hypothetical protein AAGF99_05405 [Bacteroidota bacterium]